MSKLLSDDTRYVKLLLLLFKGGTYVSKKQTLRILDDDNTTIDIFLKTHRDQIFNAFKKRDINRKLWERLSPDSGQPKNVDDWDISALAYVLLNLFDKKLTVSEIDNIIKLRNKRNELAHPRINSLSETKFLSEWSKLTTVLNKLSTRLTSNDQDYVEKLIDDVSAIQEFDKANSELKPFESTDDYVKDVLAEQLRSHEKRMDETCQRISKLERTVESLQLEISAKITVSASTQTACDAAQHQLLEAAARCLTCGHIKQDSDEVDTTLNNIFTDMSKEGAHLKKVEEGSVLVTFSCSTWTSLKRAILYLTKTLYSQRLQELEKALSQSVGSSVKLNVNIVLESLLPLLDKAEHGTNNKSVVLTMSCEGSKGVRSVCNNLVNGSSTNTVNNLSEALSRSVGQKIDLHASIDVDKLEQEISNLERRYGYHDIKRFRYQYLVLEVGTMLLKKLFDDMVQNDLMQYLRTHPQAAKQLQALIDKNCISYEQRRFLPPLAKTPDTANFDISLLICLLRNICGLKHPQHSAWTHPAQWDLSVEAEITRLKHCRNYIVHGGATHISPSDFYIKWSELCQILFRLNTFCGIPNLSELIHSVDDKPFVEQLKRSHDNILKAWHEAESMFVKSIFYIKSNLKYALSKLKLGQSEINDALPELKRGQSEIKDALSELMYRQSKIKAKQSELKYGQSELKDAQSELMYGQSELKDAQSELKYGQFELKDALSELKYGQSELKATQSELKYGQSELKDAQSELKYGQSELKDEQSELKYGQSELKYGQSEMKDEHSELKYGQSEMKDEQSELKYDQSEMKDELSKLKNIYRMKNLLFTLCDALPIKHSSTFTYDDIKKHLKSTYETAFSTVCITPLDSEDERVDILTFYVRPRMKHVPYHEDRQRDGIYEISSYEQVFCQQNTVFRNIFVTGDDGMGKTAFVQNMAFLWSKSITGDIVDNEDIQKDIIFMTKFDFLFYIILKETDQEDVVSMIVDKYFYNSPKDENWKLLRMIERILLTENCLVILDGLDEWRPDIGGNRKSSLIRKVMSAGCSYLTTCRPFIIETVRLSERDIDHLVQITGFDHEKYVREVIEYVNKLHHSNINPDDFWYHVKMCGVNSLLGIPLITTQFLAIWLEQVINKSKAKMHYMIPL